MATDLVSIVVVWAIDRRQSRVFYLLPLLTYAIVFTRGRIEEGTTARLVDSEDDEVDAKSERWGGFDACFRLPQLFS